MTGGGGLLDQMKMIHALLDLKLGLTLSILNSKVFVKLFSETHVKHKDMTIFEK
jgi:hypothetical protein